MPRSKNRQRVCKYCQAEYTLGVESTQHKYCSETCRSKWHYTKWKSSGGFRDKTKTKEYWLKHKYGISLTQYNELLQSQNFSCKICQIKEPMGYNWHVDHCHSTGIVRGILCQTCNQVLGMMKDDTNLLQKAINYLNEYKINLDNS